MNEPDLSRYTTDELQRMLTSYRTLADTHRDRGHWPLARWATGMVTAISVRLNVLEMQRREFKNRQLTLYHGGGESDAA